MFKKVLIAEDHESANISIQKTLQDLGIIHDNRNYVFYCDVAIARLQKAISDGQPYELLITDLSFDEDAPDQKITSGIELIKAAKTLQPDLKVLVFSIENRKEVAKALLNDLNIDGYVPKARNDAKDLKTALEVIYQDKKHLSQNLKQEARQEHHHTFTEYDKTIISLIYEGYAQNKISEHLKQQKIEPSGLSSIEKRLSAIRFALSFSNNAQLVAYCREKKII